VSDRPAADRLDSRQQEQLREVFSREYEIYEYLQTLVVG
jgi:hypothetical protein